MLTITYTMLGVDASEQWFHQPMLYVIGGSIYSVVSVVLLYSRPLRLIRGELSNGFSYLSEYIHVKAKLFPSKPEDQERIRNQLAQQSIKLAQQIEVCKRDLYSYSAESDAEMRKVKILITAMVSLQEMQERATSSHEQYDILRDRSEIQI